MAFLRGYGAILMSGFRASPARMIVAFVLVFSAYLTQPLAALVLKAITDAVVAHNVHKATLAALLLPVLALLTATGSRIAHVLWVEISNLNVIRFEQEEGQLSQGSRGIEHHERADYADRLALLRNEGNPLYLGIQYAASGVSLAARLVLTIVLLVRVQPSLLLLLAFGLPALYLGRLANARLWRMREAGASEWRRTQHLLDLATRPDAAAEIRIFGLEDELSQRLRVSGLKYRRQLARGRAEALALTLAGHAIFAVAYAVGLLLVVRSAVQGHQTLGNVVLALTLAAQVNSVVFESAGTTRFLQRCAEAYNRLTWLRQLIKQLYPPTPTKTARVPALVKEGIHFRGVSFTYPGSGASILRDIELEIPAGTTVAFVGENGAGKSTIMKLLCRFYDPSDGQITIDGVSLADIDPDDWRQRIAAGFQDFLRLEFALQEAVGLGDLPRLEDEQAVRRALEAASATDLLTRLPQGLKTPLGRTLPGGQELSGGQWQKVALARAMMRTDPILLILDEPTSALDAHSEHALFERYAASAKTVADKSGGIAVFVSHRFSTVRMADLIVVIDDGRIAEQGTHQELMNRNGIYAELFNLQAAAFA
jgi:ATP-binding cassette subfamily B protein